MADKTGTPADSRRVGAIENLCLRRYRLTPTRTPCMRRTPQCPRMRPLQCKYYSRFEEPPTAEPSVRTGRANLNARFARALPVSRFCCVVSNAVREEVDCCRGTYENNSSATRPGLHVFTRPFPKCVAIRFAAPRPAYARALPCGITVEIGRDAMHREITGEISLYRLICFITTYLVTPQYTTYLHK